jgi:hypothetical protein
MRIEDYNWFLGDTALDLYLGDQPLQAESGVQLPPAGNMARFNNDSPLTLTTPMSLAGDFTIEYWLKLNGTIDNKDGIVGDGSSFINYFAAQGRIYTGKDQITTSIVHEAGTWVHYAWTREGGTARVLVDGVLDTNASVPGGWTANFPIADVGHGSSSTDYLEGDLEELRIWDYARTDEEVTANYQKTVDPASAGLLLYYTFNETGTTVVDETGNGNNSSGMDGIGVSRVASDAPLTL